MKKKLLGIACVFTPVIGFGQVLDPAHEIKFSVDKNSYENGVSGRLDQLLRIKPAIEEKDGNLILTFDSNEFVLLNNSTEGEFEYDIISELEKLGVLKYENNGNDGACGRN